MLMIVIFSSTMILMVLMMMVISAITIMIKTLRWMVNAKKSTLNNEWNWIYHCWQKKTHRVKIEPTTEDHMVGVSLSAFHKPEIYLLLGIFIQRLKEVKIWPPTNVEN